MWNHLCKSLKILKISKISKDLEESLSIFVNLKIFEETSRYMPPTKKYCQNVSLETKQNKILFTKKMNELISWRLVKIPKIFKIYKDSWRSSKKSKDRRKFLTGAQKRELHVQLLSFLFVINVIVIVLLINSLLFIKKPSRDKSYFCFPLISGALFAS